MPTISYSCILFYRKFVTIGVNTSCAVHYDVIIYHRFPITSQYLKTSGVNGPAKLSELLAP